MSDFFPVFFSCGHAVDHVVGIAVVKSADIDGSVVNHVLPRLCRRPCDVGRNQTVFGAKQHIAFLYRLPRPPPKTEQGPSRGTTSSKAAARRPESSASASAVSSTSPPRAVFISTARGFISDSVRLFTI